jgi:hypothetical protein
MDNNIKKIIINKEDEITDIVSEILSTKEGNIILTFAEESDLLISSINLKVILETADENEKLLLLQIINNPSGVRNAKLAGMHVIDTANTPPTEIWNTILTEKEERLKPPKKEKAEEIIKEEKKIEEPKKSDFEQKINDAIQKSRDLPRKQETIQPEIKEDEFISLGEDLPNEEDLKPKPFPTQEVKKDFSKIDFRKTPQPENNPRPVNPKKKILDFKNIKLSRLNKKTTTEQTGSPLVNKLKKLAPIVGVGIVLVGGLSFFAYYKISSFVKIKISVEAKEVQLEETFIGDENIKEIDFENKKIPIKVESIEKSRSTTTTATGIAYKGDKAKGTVTMIYNPETCPEAGSITLASGTTITSQSGGYSYTLDESITILCANMQPVNVTAVEVGSEYNLPQGNQFNTTNYPRLELYGLNNTGAFTGGSKEEYTVLSQADVDSAVKDLEESSIAEGEEELKTLSSSWEIIESSIKSEVVKDSIKTDVAVGAEASQVNVSLKIESSATYYYKDGFDEGITELLTAEAEKQNLFDNSGDFDLILGEDIQKDISVEESDEDTVKITLDLTGSVKPDVDKEAIIAELGGLKWEEGLKALESYKYSDSPVEVSFNPNSLPEGLWYFPAKQGGILIEIKEITE